MFAENSIAAYLWSGNRRLVMLMLLNVMMQMLAYRLARQIADRLSYSVALKSHTKLVGFSWDCALHCRRRLILKPKNL